MRRCVVDADAVACLEVAITREPTAYSSVVRRLYTVQADPEVDPEPMSARLERVGLAWLAFLPRGQQPAINHLSRVSLMWMWRWRLHANYMRANRIQLGAQAAVHCPGLPRSDESSPDTQQARLILHSSRLCNGP